MILGELNWAKPSGDIVDETQKIANSINDAFRKTVEPKVIIVTESKSDEMELIGK